MFFLKITWLTWR